MSAQDARGPDAQRIEALARQVDELQRQVGGLSTALDRSGSVRKFLTLVVLIVLIVFGTLYYTRAKSFLSDENRARLLDQLQARSAENSGRVLQEVHTLFDNTKDKVSVAFAERAKQDMPLLMNKFGEERDSLVLNIRDKFQANIDREWNTALAKHQSVLQEEFPEVKDPDAFGTMIHNFQDACKPLVKQMYGDRIEAEFRMMASLWDDFPKADSRKSQDELADELYGLLLELAQEKMTRSGQLEIERQKEARDAAGS